MGWAAPFLLSDLKLTCWGAPEHSLSSVRLRAPGYTSPVTTEQFESCLVGPKGPACS
jgi:hypothetical protein